MWENGQTFRGYQITIFWGYSNLHDFLWKSPQFIDAEEQIEKAKLASRYPDEGDEQTRKENAESRRRRAQFEGAKLYLHFPVMVAQSNLYLSLSWFEKHLNRLARFADEEHGSDYKGARGNGPSRYFAHFKSLEIDCSKFEAFERINLAIQIRNALLHASGDLKISRDQTRIRQAVDAELYVERTRRKGDGGMPDKQGRPEVWIQNDTLGVNHYYSMRVVRDALSLLIDISSRLDSALEWQPKQGS